MLKAAIVSMGVFLGIMVAAPVFIPNRALAAVDPTCANSTSFLGFPTWFKYLDVGKKELKKESKTPEGAVITTDIRTDDCAIIGPNAVDPVTGEEKFDWSLASGRILLAIFEIILRVGGIVAVGFVTFGGIQYILSQGEPDKLKGARSTIVNALIGLAIAASATAIVNLIGRNIT